ncbi:SDR family NAD(P)-dependent oxidoreductase [Streptomyces mirabilis]|uniref:SDR family NAD(P)-dependent oxidoreductase n=1 Tax=Streptomyces mirabilis TaxID=68239 RepID=UPI003665BE64
MPRFTDKTVIIIGAAGALGVGMVRRIAAEDARVVIGARQREQVADLLDELGADRAVFARLDATGEQHWTAAVATAEAAVGPVSVLVNNAARAIVGTTMSLTPDDFREVIDTNLVGTHLGTRAAVPSMRRRAAAPSSTSTPPPGSAPPVSSSSASTTSRSRAWPTSTRSAASCCSSRRTTRSTRPARSSSPTAATY